MKNPANVTRRRKKAQQALAPGFGTGAITHQAPGKYTGKGLKGAAEGATVKSPKANAEPEVKPAADGVNVKKSSTDLINEHYNRVRAQGS